MFFSAYFVCVPKNPNICPKWEFWPVFGGSFGALPREKISSSWDHPWGIHWTLDWPILNFLQSPQSSSTTPRYPSPPNTAPCVAPPPPPNAQMNGQSRRSGPWMFIGHGSYGRLWTKGDKTGQSRRPMFISQKKVHWMGGR